jgi:hypothetical protein
VAIVVDQQFIADVFAPDDEARSPVGPKAGRHTKDPLR